MRFGEMTTSRGARFMVAHSQRGDAPGVELYVSQGGFGFDDYLTADECMVLAAKLTAAAVMLDPGPDLEAVDG